MQSPNKPNFGAMPSFQSVIEHAAEDSKSSGFFSNASMANATAADFLMSPIDAPLNPFHQPRNSISTSASDSTESSPTTTASLDSSSMTDPSPGPSPQSPVAASFAMAESRFITAIDNHPLMAPSKPPTSEKPLSVTPAKRARNLKNLAVNTSASYGIGRGFSTAPIKTQEPERTSAPASPTFVKPPPPPRRKLGNISLTIMTPVNNGNMPVPPTPSATIKTPALRHFQSSPSLPLLTAGVGPAGGMTLPKPRQIVQPRGFAEIPMEDEEEQEPNFDVPQSQEEKPDSYPNGPIRIYESGVDLYYEPNAEVASRYDVVINVASEVKNPFHVADEKLRVNARAMTSSSNVGILLDGSQNAGSPTTPKATPISTDIPADFNFAGLSKKNRPEYIHMLWDHNTDIVKDLYSLVRLIDDRVEAGKTVLVHCQCGVSRSASLIVAYGLYKNQDMSVQDAYNAVKKRSKWIGPNMNLIMQLQEFKNGLSRGSLQAAFNMPRKSSTLPSASTDSFGASSPSEPPTPRTCPLPPEHDASSEKVLNSGPFSAGPIDPTAGFWDAALRRSMVSDSLSLSSMSLVPDTPGPYVDAKGHLLPVTVVSNEQSPLALPNDPKTTFRTPNFTGPLPFRRDYDGDMQMSNAEPLSPRAMEFHMTPVSPPRDFMEHDASSIFSPTVPKFPSLPASPPAPKRAPPPVPVIAPIVTAIPLANANRNDSVINRPEDFIAKGKTPMRPLRTKISAPNLSQCIQLQMIQTDIANSLPRRPAEAEEALMSPRAGEFIANPFHRPILPKTIKEYSPIAETAEEAALDRNGPTTPTTSESDPRSPASFGISPITRNIFDVIE